MKMETSILFKNRLSIFTICSIFCVLTYGIDRPRGVSMEKASFYQGGTEFRCISTGKRIPMDHINDDYCDCEDGSDEPGTSACNNGLFYCENKSYKGNYIMSTRVNDGICDCCDGSDEYDGTISCENTCEKLFAEIRAQQEAFRAKQEAGYKVKLEYIQNGRRTKDEKLAKLTELSKEKEIFAQERDVLQAAKEEAEVPEKEAKAKHEQAWEAVKAEKKKQAEAAAAAVAFGELDTNGDQIVDYPELTKHAEFDIDSDGTVSDEEAKEYLEDSDQVDLVTFTEKIWPNIKEIYKPIGSKEEAQSEPTDPTKQEKTSEEGEAPADPANAKPVEEEQMPDYDEETKRLISVADEARAKFDEADRKVKDVENEISAIKKYLELDLGPEEEFSALKGQCFEYTDREYTYRFCPFEKTSQKPKGGGMETNLGNWGHWHGPENDKYDAMKYENGQSCWNGPNRSCHVNLHCGAENALIGASEPSRCEYQFEFTTPSRCSAPPAPGTHYDHEEL
ncbi:glucosidase 2 subunit beta-like isoform X2 [Biomphalaria glabrata]|uniref:Glucosidase 2 subunit beta n=1 Tax=Biomphalaria glabrata TaxID=6526 RepID=A0A9W3AF29_BIOGL|nr:glucosidase 2 subunit beta-like isoform X2 [Biomphalaria glabrata]